MNEDELYTKTLSNFNACLELRKRYMQASFQRPGDNPRDALTDMSSTSLPSELPEDTAAAGPHHFVFKLDSDGVYKTFLQQSDADKGVNALWTVPTWTQFYDDAMYIKKIITEGPAKTLGFRRLGYLQLKFDLHVLLNEQLERSEQKKASHRDFYNVRKVDTHVHHSSSMNCKHLLRFIKSKIKTASSDVVIFRDGKYLTLEEVFKSLNLTAYDLSIDVLDMHAHKDSFHRFDRFNTKYNPVGEARLREIFLKIDNHINGRYLAELTREVITDLESSRYQLAEYRLSVYGTSVHEFDNLARWVIDNKLSSPSVRWLVQLPRLYSSYKSVGKVASFEDIIKNIFQPLFEVTKDPQSNPKLHSFLSTMHGFDSVDDESHLDEKLSRRGRPPRLWKHEQNPPYNYYAYYFYANIAQLNFFRRERGLNTFSFRPHSGEAGDPYHLIDTFLVAEGINHGIMLRKAPALEYLYYLAQIHISMSPLSNNALFLSYARNPFQEYFKRGLLVTLSTDDPLQFHFTRDPLIEEYSVAAQFWKLSSCDMCEIAQNSVIASGFDLATKKQFLGRNYSLPGPLGNDVNKSNVPNTRAAFRYEMLIKERELVEGSSNISPPTRRSLSSLAASDSNCSLFSNNVCEDHGPLDREKYLSKRLSEMSFEKDDEQHKQRWNVYK